MAAQRDATETEAWEPSACPFCTDSPDTTALIAAAKRVTAAFRAHGESRAIGTDIDTRRECEAAMVALDAALAKVSP